MMSKFIEVHGKDNGMPISVNVENIVAFEPGDIALRTVGILKIAESYDELKQLILDAGVLIHKADPRLDTTTPLTLEDLKNMIGEPVWNSNSGKWGIVETLCKWNDSEESILILHENDENDEGVEHIWMESKDLIKFPLYRMRQ